MNEKIKELVTTRLSGFGVTVTEADDLLLAYVIAKIERDIKNFCNIAEVPEELYYVWSDAVCADFLHAKLSSGTLENVSSIVKSISEGDTTISFSENSTPEGQLLVCLSTMELKNSDLIRYRKIVW